MSKIKKRDSRATVEAARKTAYSRIIAAIIGAVAIIVAALLGIFFYGNDTSENNKGEFKSDTMQKVDTIRISKTAEQPEHHDSVKIIFIDHYSLYLKKIERLINDEQYAQAFRKYVELYDSLPSNMKDLFDQKNIEKAKEIYVLGRWRKAALLMKNYFDTITQY